MGKRNRGGGGTRNWSGSIEGVFVGIIMFLAMVIGVYAILPTFFDSTNSTAVAALNAPSGATGIFTALPIIAAIIIAVVLLVVLIRGMLTKRSAG